MNEITPPVSHETVQAAKDTYELEMALGGGLNDEALNKALEAGIAAHDRRRVQDIANLAEMMADQCDDPQSGVDAVTLRYFADTIRKELPADPNAKEPQDGDVIEVRITGEVIVEQTECDHCNTLIGKATFCVHDDAIDRDIYFDMEDVTHHGLRWRLLHRDG